MKDCLYNKYRLGVRRLVLFVISLNIILISKIFFIQVVEHHKYKSILENETVLKLDEEGERGKIYDVNGIELADNIIRYDFWVNTSEEFDKDAIATIFSQTFNKNIDYYLNLLNNKSHYVSIETDVEKLYCENIIKSIGSLRGLRYNASLKRFYPYDNIVSSVVGFFSNKQSGSSGIEDYFNDALSGDQLHVEHQILDNQKIKYAKTDIPCGKNIKLTIDLELQSILVSELEKGLKESSAKSANGVIVDPHTGFILAMASVPDFNPNQYQDFNPLNYKNRVISDSYEPGSTYKIIALTAAIENSKINLQDSIYCENGYYKLKNGHILHDHEAHGMLSVPEVFAFSSNIGMAKIAGLLSIQELYDKSRQFGFGVDTGILLPNEESGMLRETKDWSYLSNKSIAIGQEISCTTLQTAMAYSAIANGGFLLQPIIINSIDGQHLTKSPVIIREVTNPKTSKTILALLEKVVDSGGGSNAYLEGYSVGGKTGTAQKFINGEYSNSEYISSFASIFPIEKPKYVCVISVDSPDKKRGKHWGNETAAPIVKNIYKKIINQKGIKPETFFVNIDTNINRTVKQEYIDRTIIPDFRGKTLKESIKISKNIGVKIKPAGYSGRVVWQSIKAGTGVEDVEICELKVE